MTPNAPTSDDLMERLRFCGEHGLFDAAGVGMVPDLLKAADHIAALRARCEALEGALDEIAASAPNHCVCCTMMGNTARAALPHRIPPPEAK